jgi:hypothetical protein
MMRSSQHFALVLFLVVLVAAVGVQASPDRFVVVRNVNNPTTKISVSQLKDMLIGRKKVWPHGAVVVVAVGAPGSAELKWLSETLLHVSQNILMTKIRQEVFKGEMRRPIVVLSEKEAVEVVAANLGAVGVLRATVAAAAASQVAVVQIF